jgi:hypothetical protein
VKYPPTLNLLEGKVKVIHRKVLCVTVIKGVVFRPGMNSISDSEYDLISETDHFKSEINCGNMLIGGSYDTETTNAVDEKDPKARAYKQAEEIASMSVRDAEKVVAEISDTDVLRALEKVSTKKGIKEIAEKRIKAVKNQEGADLAPETKVAPEGTGEDLIGAPENVTKAHLEGNISTSAIPALN